MDQQGQGSAQRQQLLGNSPTHEGDAELARSMHQQQQPQHGQMMAMTVPAGVKAGDTIAVRGPTGVQTVVVPTGLGPGQQFTVCFGAAPQQQQQQQHPLRTGIPRQHQGHKGDPREIQRLAPRMHSANGEITIVAVRRTYTLAKRMVHSASTRRCRKLTGIAIVIASVLVVYLWASPSTACSVYKTSDTCNDDAKCWWNGGTTPTCSTIAGPNFDYFLPVMLGVIVCILGALKLWRTVNIERSYAIWEHAIMTSESAGVASCFNASVSARPDGPWDDVVWRGYMGWAKFLNDDITDELSGVDPQTMVRNLTDNMKVLTSKLQGFNYNYSTTAQQLASDGLVGVTIEGHVGDRRDQYHALPAAAPPANPMAFQNAAPMAATMPPATGAASKFCGQCAATLTPGNKFCQQCAAPN
jgi:hypothetical protein